MSAEQSIRSKTSKIITSKNKSAMMLDCPGNRSKVSDMEEAEPTFQFPHSLPIPVAINTP